MPGAGFCLPICGERSIGRWAGRCARRLRPAVRLAARSTGTCPGGALRRGALHEVAGGEPRLEHAAAPISSPPASWPASRGRSCGASPAATSSRRASPAPAWTPTGSSTPRPAATATCCRRRGGAARAAGSPASSARSPRLGLDASRRLQLAAEASGVTGLRRCGAGWRPPTRRLAQPDRRGDPLAHRARAVGRRSPVARRRPRPAGGSSSCAAAAANLVPGLWRRAMRRVVSLFLPTWPTDRLRRRLAARRRRMSRW